MTQIYSAPTFDTPEIAELRQLINTAHQELAELIQTSRVTEKERLARYNELLLVHRPSYPVPEQLAAMDAVLQMQRAGTQYGDHHGYPTPTDRAAGTALPYDALYHSESNRFHIMTRSPYKADTADLLWDFTDDERLIFAQELEKRDFTIISSYRHHDGHAFILSLAKE